MQDTQEAQPSALEIAEANLNAAEEAAASGQGQVKETAQDTQSAASEAPDPIAERFSKLEQEFKQNFNRVFSELGGVRNLRSEFDKLTQAQKQQIQQAPKSWAELDEQSQKVTREILRHVLQEEFGDKFKAVDTLQEQWQQQQSAQKVESLAREEFGQEFDKYNPVLYEIVESVKALAQQGRPDAQKFLEELKTTESGAYRLFGMARAQMAQSLQAKNEKANQEQEQKAKRAAVGVGGTKSAPSTVDSMGLPKKGSANRLEAMEAMLEKLESQRGR